ncbi:hypothetical protein BBG47_07075 [Paenibacillus sp. KS1]|nr:hypothetical protein BBG47_07075 [Paenibacillus sp. KS1]
MEFPQQTILISRAGTFISQATARIRAIVTVLFNIITEKQSLLHAEHHSFLSLQAAMCITMQRRSAKKIRDYIFLQCLPIPHLIHIASTPIPSTVNIKKTDPEADLHHLTSYIFHFI